MRMNICRYLLTALICTCSSAAVLAQDSTLIGVPLKWDIQKCIEYAKKNNIQINSLRLSQKISEQEFLLAKASRLPDLSASASQNFGHSNSAGSGSGRSGFTASGNYGLSSSVTLYNGNYINNNIAQKNLAQQVANLSVMQQENDITLQITQAYLTILLDKETIVYNSDVVTTSQAQLKQYQQKFDVGAIARKDLVQLQAQVATDQYNLVTAKNQERQDLLTLKQLLLLPTDATFDVVKPDTIAPVNTNTPLHDAEQIALKNRPEIKSGQLAVDIAQYDVAKANAGYKPFLSAGGSVGASYVTGNGDYFSQLNRNFNQQIGLNLSIPIFTKRQVKTQVEEAKIGVDQAKLDFTNTRITLSQQVERAYINVQNAQGQYEAAQQEFKFNQESYRIANEQLKVGVANMVEFLQQKNLYIQAQQSYIQSKYNTLLSLKIYDFYKGIPITL
ncbi:TolC family protein [Mucilaginibacter mali]|uniref:TolC family protein n=2 Tax=Mucilaginibacter mali TaxID=2740462 RepID=A0A7D4UCP4_9SPHI|nr:TolC family protein [Mucilaginibacter mali]